MNLGRPDPSFGRCRTNATILITGGSHIAALNEGLDRLLQSGEMPPGLDFLMRPLGGGLSVSGKFFRVQNDHVEITDPKFRRRVSRIPPDGVPCDVVVLCTTLYSRPVWSKADWAVYGVSGVSKGRILASDSMLRRIILDDTRYLIELLKHLQAFGIAVCVVEGPRPFRHNIEVKRAGVKIVKYIDQLYRSLTLDLLAREEVPVIAVPEFAFDDDGFMHEKYRHRRRKDGTHGNSDFGRLMMLEIVRYVQRFVEPRHGT